MKIKNPFYKPPTRVIIGTAMNHRAILSSHIATTRDPQFGEHRQLKVVLQRPDTASVSDPVIGTFSLN